MTKRDIESHLDLVTTLDPLRRTATGTGASVDLQGYDSAMAVFHAGLWVDGTHTPKLQDSADGTTFADAGTADQLGTFAAVLGTATDQIIQKVGYIGDKQFVRGFVTVAGATTGADYGFTIVRGHAHRQPL